MAFSTLIPTAFSALLPLTAVYCLTSGIYPIDTHLLFTAFREPYLVLDLTLAQVLITAVLTNLSLAFHTQSHHSPSAPIATASLHYLATLLGNHSFAKSGVVRTLLFRLLQPCFTSLFRFFLTQHSVNKSSTLGFILTLLGVFRFSVDDTQLSAVLPLALSTLLFSARDFFLRPVLDDSTDGKPEQVSAIRALRRVLHTALPLAAFVSFCKWCLLGGSMAPFPYLLRNASLLAVYHTCSLLLHPRLDAVAHGVIATLRRFSAILVVPLVFGVPVSRERAEGIVLAFGGFALFVSGRTPRRVSARGVLYAVVSAVLVFGVFLGAAGVVTGLGGGRMVFNRGESVERVNSGGVVVIPVNDYRSSRGFVRYGGYEEAVKHEGGNVGNLVWKYAAHERLPEFGDVVCEDDVMECVEKARNRGLEHVVYKPVANILNPDTHGVFQQPISGMKEAGMRLMMVGMGVQIAFRFKSGDPEFNASARITTRSEDFVHTENTKKFLKGMEDIGGELLLRGDFSLNVTRSGGFTRGHSLGCPSLWMNDDIHLGATLEKKYSEIAARQNDKTLKIAVNIKNMSPGMEEQIMHLRDNYPNSRFYIQGRGDVRLLSSLKVPYERTRLFTNVEDWIEDLREMDVSYGVRIHGNMIAIAAGVPVVVVASDWRVLELVQRMKIPFVTTYDKVFERDLDVAGIVARLPRFDGDVFDRNRCGIAKTYIEVFARYGFGVKSHVRQVSELC